MRLIFKIASAELRLLFYSPIAWIIAIAFYVVCGVAFGGSLVTMAASQQFFIDNTTNWPGFDFSLTRQLFFESYKYLLNNLYLFIPLLTMSVINKEMQAGTIHLLNSSPIKTRHIVLGKYLGLMAYNVIILSTIFLLIIVGNFSIVDPELKLFLSALAGIYLLACTYAAIGLFISSLTNYPIVAALITFLTLAILGMLAYLWQQYDFFRDLTYSLNISGRVESMITGLIATNDIIYFVLIIAMFLAFTLIKLRNKRESRPWYIFFARYITVVVVVVGISYIASRPSFIGYWDVTRDKVNTIHPRTLQALQELDGSPVEITLYANLLNNSFFSGSPNARNNYLSGVWGQYIRFYPNLQFKYVYYYDIMGDDSTFMEQYKNLSVEEVAKKTIKVYGLPSSIFKSPEEMKNIIDLSEEGKRLVMELKYKGKKTFLRTYDDVDVWPNQLHFSAAFKRLARPSAPLLLFTTGHYERSPYKVGEREYAVHTLYKLSRTALLNQGVDVDTISLADRDIPAATSILAIPDPKVKFTSEESARIMDYLNKGGDAIIYSEPGKQAMVNPFLAGLGVKVDDGIIVGVNKDEMPHIAQNYLTDAGARLALENVMFLYQLGKVDSIYRGLYGFSNISMEPTDGVTIEPIFELSGNGNTWNERGRYMADSAAPIFSPMEGDTKRDKYITGIKITRRVNNKEQRIIVVSDSDFMSILRLSGMPFGNAAYSWLLHNDYPDYTNYPFPTDNYLNINRQEAKGLRITFVYIIPAIVMVIGFIVLLRRKRK